MQNVFNAIIKIMENIPEEYENIQKEYEKYKKQNNVKINSNKINMKKYNLEDTNDFFDFNKKKEIEKNDKNNS
ncbi:hypothetical protein C3H43_01875 [Campylobacter jejuni]|uniref:hypothetical protein n=1 Tax=Campylobacter jejuni TaxID=197 RepID=UPI000F80B81C|nr:hypothetical protein [Campylobacter jejuni]RTJ79960.1 hypothetical protein C3H52_02540 [Campylobacter jejuni]RTJ96168.1 hypothetical protein C3H43_01875 [Campylobacter jejuni]